MPEPDDPVDAPKRILIAEDEPSMARAIKRVLTRAGYETVIASDGFWTGSLLYTFKPDLITLDLRMPGLDGLDVLRFLRQAAVPFNYKVLVVSAETQDRINEALSLGAHGALSKPFENADLLDAVRRLCGEPAANITG